VDKRNRAALERGCKGRQQARVTDKDIQGNENANPVKTLLMRYAAWKKAGSKRTPSIQ
jgi:hypothetical protein